MEEIHASSEMNKLRETLEPGWCVKRLWSPECVLLLTKGITLDLEVSTITLRAGLSQLSIL